MRDLLINFASVVSAKSRLSAWASKDEANRDVFRLPTHCQMLEVQAYTDAGTPPVITEDGEVKDPGTPPTEAPGRWYIVSLDRGETLPKGFDPSFIKAEAERDEGMRLPVGIVALSTRWAGMKVFAA